MRSIVAKLEQGDALHEVHLKTPGQWEEVVLPDGTPVHLSHIMGEVTVAYGAVDRPGPNKATEFHLVVEVNGEAVRDTHSTDDVLKGEPVYLEFGQEEPSWLSPQAELRWDQSDQPIVDWYLGGGPDLATVPLMDLDDYTKQGPNPDPEDADQTGSGRLAAYRHPAWMAMLLSQLLGDGPTAAQLADTRRWTRDQARRGYCVYTAADNCRPYTAHQNPQWLLGQGYRAGGGGFSTHYSHELPPGIAWVKSGLATGNALHMTLEQLAMSGVFTRSPCALRLAVHLFEAISSYMPEEFWASGRGHGRYIKSLALLWFCGHRYDALVGGLDHLPKVYLPAVLAKVRSQNRIYTTDPETGDPVRHEHLDDVPDNVLPRVSPVVDSGSSTDGGHLQEDEVRPFLEALGKGEDAKEASQSGTSWTNAQLYIGLEDALDLVPMEPDTHQEADYQLKLCALFLVHGTGGYGLDIHKPITQAVRRPAFGNWDDWGPMYGLAEGGDGTNFAHGVGIRFLVPALYRLAQRFPGYGEQVKALAAPILAECDSGKHWNTKDFTRAMLEFLWPVGKDRGWWGTSL